jgi:regulator of replication initiation timing
MSFHSSINTGLILATAFNGKLKLDELENRVNQLSGGIDFSDEFGHIKHHLAELTEIVNNLGIEVQSLKFEHLASKKSQEFPHKIHKHVRKQQTINIETNEESDTDSDDSGLDNFIKNN